MSGKKKKQIIKNELWGAGRGNFFVLASRYIYRTVYIYIYIYNCIEIYTHNEDGVLSVCGGFWASESLLCSFTECLVVPVLWDNTGLTLLVKTPTLSFSDPACLLSLSSPSLSAFLSLPLYLYFSLLSLSISLLSPPSQFLSSLSISLSYHSISLPPVSPPPPPPLSISKMTDTVHSLV